MKWNIEKAIKGETDYIVDRVDVHYNVGHTKAAGSIQVTRMVIG